MKNTSSLVNDPSGMGWQQGTSEGSELAQLKVWAKLLVQARLEALDEMNTLARHFLEQRRQQRLPYFDPFTNQLVRGEV